MTQPAPIDPCRCPLCGQANACVMDRAEGGAPAEPCWCTREHFGAPLLLQVPASAKDRACICQACVKAQPSA